MEGNRKEDKEDIYKKRQRRDDANDKKNGREFGRINKRDRRRKER